MWHSVAGNGAQQTGAAQVAALGGATRDSCERAGEDAVQALRMTAIARDALQTINSATAG